MPVYEPLWLYEANKGVWGECAPVLSQWLENLPDNEKGDANAIAPDISTPTLLRWRYNIEAKEQYREERPNEESQWTITATKKIRRVLKPVDGVLDK